MKYLKIPIYALAAIFVATPTLALADDELEEAELFFELNDTDGDLGIHGFGDGGPWKEFEIEGPRGRELLEIDVKSRLKYQGLTEIFFESAEPTFDELDPERFFERFPKGWYEMEIELLDGGEDERRVYLSHIIPAAPDWKQVTVNGDPAAEDCDGVLPTVGPDEEVIIDWAAVTDSHDELGKSGNIEVIYYEVVMEIDESFFKSTAIVPPDVTQWTFPSDFLELGEEIKFEILVRVDNGKGNPGNKSAMESCFEVE